MLTEFLIASMCAAQSGVYLNACNNATRAASAQSGFTASADTAEKVLMNKITNETGKQVWAVGGFAVKAVKDKRLKYNIKMPANFLDVHKISPAVDYGSDKSGSMNLMWEW